jgi:hypothetical protein
MLAVCCCFAAADFQTGGRGIIDGLEKEMQLSRQQVEPSRASLYRFGNTSSTRCGTNRCGCMHAYVSAGVEELPMQDTSITSA